MAGFNLRIFISLAAPLAMTLFVCRGRARRFALFLLIGMTVTLLAGYWNGFINGVSGYPSRYFSSVIGPFSEELFKLLPLLVYTFAVKPRRETLLECAVAVGVGFAILENASYMFKLTTDFSASLALIRGFGTGIMHGLCTLSEGIGLSFVRTRRKLFYTGTAGLFLTAVTYHSLFNQLVLSAYELVGYFLPVVTLIPVLLVLNRKNKHKTQA